MLSRPRPSYGKPRLEVPGDRSTARAVEASTECWQTDLRNLLRDANKRFADFAWCLQEGGQEEIWAHKAIIYARSGGQFQLKYLSAPAAAPHSRLPGVGSQVSLPGTLVNSLTPSLASVRRAPSPGAASLNTLSPTIRQRAILSNTNPELFKSILHALYTGSGLAETLSFLFEDPAAGDSPEARADKLRKDLLYMWRSKLYADCRIMLVSSDGQPHSEEEDAEDDAVFAAHRAILCSRSPYFQSLLLDPYADSGKRVFSLPSPPFTPASLHFSLGYLYCGTLEFANRTFNLTTAMQIWRSAQYLGVESMKEEIEARIKDMCHGFGDLCKPCVDRVGRVYAFSRAPDVASDRLRTASQDFTVKAFGEVWCREIGELDYEAQTQLVDLVCTGIDPNTCIDAIRNSKRLKERLSTERAQWADHLQAMMEPIDQRIAKTMRSKFPAIVTSKAFLDLLEGVGFSNDVLERALLILVANLQEETAAETYQVLVGQVLLREEGIPMDARVRVEDARAGVLRFLKKKWVSVRQHSGFEPLENWALKEISDELDVPVDDLLMSPVPAVPVTRTGLRVTTPKSAKPVNVVATDDEQGVTAASLRAAVLNRNAARHSASNGHRGSVATTASGMTGGSVRSRVATLNGSTTAPSTTGTVTSRKRPSMANRSASTARKAAGPPTEGSQGMSRSKTPSRSTLRGEAVDANAEAGPSSAPASPPKPSRPPPLPPVVTTTASPQRSPVPSGLSAESNGSASPGASPKLTAKGSGRKTPSLASVRSTASSLRTRNPAASSSTEQLTPRAVRARTTTANSIRSNASLASTAIGASSATAGARKLTPTPKIAVVRKSPSTLSVRSEASVATTSTVGRRPRLAQPTKPPVASASKAVGSPAATSSARGKTLSTSKPLARLRTTSATARTHAASNAKPSGPPVPRPSSVTSVRSAGSVRTTTSVRTKTPNANPAASRSSARKGKDKAPPMPRAPSADPPAARARTPSGAETSTTETPPRRKQAESRPSAPASVESDETNRHTGSHLSTVTLRAPQMLRPPPNGKPPGSTLLVGIPCVVSTASEGQPTKFRAVVKYLGETFFDVGQWVGVEVAERDDMPHKQWHDGSVDGIRYFELGQESKESRLRLSRTLTATPSRSGGDRSEDSSVNSLRPSFQSRSSSGRKSDVSDEGVTPTRGLFVRPHEVIFVF